MSVLKPLTFLGTTLNDLRDFPSGIKSEAGYQLDKIQHGVMPDDFKPMPDVGKGVMEIRLRDESGAYRVFYVAKFEAAVYVLHCFQKKTQKTRLEDIQLGQQRYQEILEQLKNKANIKSRKEPKS